MPKDLKIETNDKETTIALPNSGEVKGNIIAELNEIVVADKPIEDSYAKELAFMEELVDVVVAESTDPNAENPVQVAVNGINQFFERGRTQTVKRKYVEVLARARRGTITTPEMTINGERTAGIRRVSAQAYPFSVVRDDNPRGMPWLRGVMQEGA